jgi:hypothetical protein
VLWDPKVCYSHHKILPLTLSSAVLFHKSSAELFSPKIPLVVHLTTMAEQLTEKYKSKFIFCADIVLCFINAVSEQNLRIFINCKNSKNLTFNHAIPTPI